MFNHLLLPRAPFFLLALPERFFLWKNASPLEATPPDYEIDASLVLQPYAGNLHMPLAALSEDGFDILVRSWLDDVVNSTRLRQSDQWLAESGLYDAIKQGSIKTQEPV
jgi:hypothetical protein